MPPPHDVYGSRCLPKIYVITYDTTKGRQNYCEYEPQTLLSRINAVTVCRSGE